MKEGIGRKEGRILKEGGKEGRKEGRTGYLAASFKQDTQQKRKEYEGRKQGRV